MARIIKPGGVFLLITYGQPKTRLHYLCKEKFGWDVEQRTVGTGHPHFSFRLSSPVLTS